MVIDEQRAVAVGLLADVDPGRLAPASASSALTWSRVRAAAASSVDDGREAAAEGRAVDGHGDRGVAGPADERLDAAEAASACSTWSIASAVDGSQASCRLEAVQAGDEARPEVADLDRRDRRRRAGATRRALALPFAVGRRAGRRARRREDEGVRPRPAPSRPARPGIRRDRDRGRPPAGRARLPAAARAASTKAFASR